MKKQFQLAASLICLLSILLLGQEAKAQTDVGVIAIPVPENPVCPGIRTVKCVIQNFGTDPIDSVMLGWELNG